MPRYLFGFHTYSMNEPGVFLAAGNGDEVGKATTENVGKFARLMTMTNPEMIPAYIPEIAQPKIESQQPTASKLENKKRK